MRELANSAQSGDVVVFYQSSHGGNNGTSSSPSRSAYLVEYDATYEDSVFAQDLALFKDGVSVVVVLDSCYSAGMYKDAPVFDFAAGVMEAYEGICKAKSVKGANVGWITASDWSETSLTARTYSYFTQFVIEAFARGDANGDRRLTFKELFDYAYPRTQSEHHPQISNTSLLGELVAAAADSSAPTVN
jgi:hypothetical protein